MNITLASRNSTKIVSVWNATGFEKGFYPIIADASPVLGEIDTENNTKIADNLVLVLNSGHDVAVKNITSKTVVGEGYSLIVNVTIVNVGSYTEAFNVTVSANSTHIASQDIILESGASTTINLAWNTTGFEKGNYTMSVSAEPVLEESDVTDNTLYEWIAISILGDVNGDFCVEGKDVAMIAKAYDTRLGDPRWIANADINGDNIVEGKDNAIVAKHYDQSYP